MLAPVALYPDPLLAQILVAATYVDQLEDAAAFTRRYRDPYGIDHQPWDVSVKAVAHYPSVLDMMVERIDWTIALGQAYVDEPGAVMAAVQHLRWMAHRAGNLASNRYIEVIPAGEYIEIVPFQPEFIYVPVYEPEVIFFRPGVFLAFGPAFPIGVWLNRDCDWRGHRVYYHGWRGGSRWVERSRTRVHITNVYVSDRFRDVRVNREVTRRSVNVQNLNRFSSVHREANFNNLNRRGDGRDNRNANDNRNFDNRNFRRDGDNPRNGALRGRSSVEQPGGRQAPAAPGGIDRSPRGRDDAARIDRAQRARQERQDRTPPAVENRSFRGREQNQPDGRQAPAAPTERFRERARGQSEAEIRSDRGQRAREGRPPQALENRSSFRAREQARPEARQAPQSIDRAPRGREERQIGVRQAPPDVRQGRGEARGERNLDRRPDREQGPAIRSRPQSPAPVPAAERPQGRGRSDADRSRTQAANRIERNG